MRVLLYHQPDRSVSAILRMLEQFGVSAESCQSQSRFIHLCMTDRYTALLVVADVGPEPLIALYKSVREQGCRSPLLVLHKSQSALNRAACLAAGIDQYLIEPYSYTYLISLLFMYDGSLPGNLQERYCISEFELYPLSWTALFRGERIQLSKMEFNLLFLLVRRFGTVLSRVQIWEEIWGFQDYPLANTVDVHINRLRKKLPLDAGRLIRTVYGIGYQLVSQNQLPSSEVQQSSERLDKKTRGLGLAVL